MGEERKQPVKVACSIPNGVALRLSETIDGEFGLKQMRQVGEPVILAGPRNTTATGVEITEVDPDFWEKWIVQNSSNPIVVGEHVRAVDPAKRADQRAD